MKGFYPVQNVVILIAFLWRQVSCVGYIKSWQTFQNYGNRDLFNEFTIVFQLEHGIISSDVIRLRVPFSIGDLREYPIIKWYELSELTCVFDYLPNSMKAIQLDYINSIYEYSLQFNETSTFMEKGKWYQMNVQSGENLSSSLNDVVIKIGMSTYSGLSTQTSILYDQNLELSTIYISPVVQDALVLTVSNRISYDLLPLRVNRVQLNIRQSVIESSGRLLIELSGNQFKFASTSICTSIQDSSQSNVVVMQSGSYTCTVQSDKLELIYFDQPIINLRIFVLQFDVQNSAASDSCDLIVYQMEPYTNLLLDRGSIPQFIQTTPISLLTYDLFLSFGQRPSDVFQLYQSFVDYNVYNTISIRIQPQISTPDVLSRLIIELGTSYFSVLQGSIWYNLPYYNPTIQPYCESVGQQIICDGIGSLSSQILYIVSFKLLINYSYTINIIPPNFLNLAFVKTSSGSQIIYQNGQSNLQVRSGMPKLTNANTIAASYKAPSMPKQIEDALGSLKQMQYDPTNPQAKQVLGFLIKDDGSGVVQDDAQNKGYIIYTTPMITVADNTVSPTCLTKTNTQLSGCLIDIKSDLTTFRFIGNRLPFQPQLVESSSMVLVMYNIAITSFGQMGGQGIMDFYIQTYTGGLQEQVQQSQYLKQNYLVNAYVFSDIVLANVNVMSEIINYKNPNSNLSIDGFNTISLLKIIPMIKQNDVMMSANYDFPLRIEVFFDNMQLLPLYNSDEIEQISDPYEYNRISCIGNGIKCYSIPSQVYANPTLSTSYSFISLNRIQIQFDSIQSMVALYGNSILIPFIPVSNTLQVNLFLTLSHVLKDYGLKKPLLNFKQVNRPVSTTFLDTSTDTTIKVNDGTSVQYDLQQKALGQIIDPFNILFNYPKSPPTPKYILYTTLWNYTDSFVPSNTVTSFTAQVQNITQLTCTPISYRIQNLNTYGFLCPIQMTDPTATPTLTNTFVSMSRIQFPDIYGTELPRSAISVVDNAGNLRSFAYLNSKSKIGASTFNFKGMVPKLIMELQKGLEILFNIVPNHKIPPNFIFTIQNSNNNSLNIHPVQISNGCIVNNDITIGSYLEITDNQIKCSFSNTQIIPQGPLTILVVSISVLQQQFDASNPNEVEYMMTFIGRIYTSRNILISKSDRGKKMLYQKQRQFGDSNSKITIGQIDIKQIREDNVSISFILNFVQKDWDDFENLTCNFTPFLNANPANMECKIIDLSNNKQNFISQCYMSDRNLLATRNLDITLYDALYSYSYKIEILNINIKTIVQQSDLANGIFSCASIEPSSNNPILELDIPVSNLQINYDLIDIAPIGPLNGIMNIIKRYTYPGLAGQLQIKFTPTVLSSDEIAWSKNTIFQLSFPQRYISSLSNQDNISCFQNQINIPCSMLYSHTLQINSLAQESKPSSTILDFFGIQEPSGLVELNSSGQPQMFELLIVDGSNNKTLSYYKQYDIQMEKSQTLNKIRFLNSSQTANVTFIQSDFYNFTMIFASNTPLKTKLILEFPYSYIDIFNNYQPDSCVMKVANGKDTSLQCIAQSNRISITSDISETFTLYKGLQYQLVIKVTKCNSEKVNILVFDDSTDTQQLMMVSGESQSAARNISLTAETTLSSFNISKTDVNLVYGVVSEQLTISINNNQRSQKQIEFSNKYNIYIQMNPTVPVIPIGEYQTTFTIEVIDPVISGVFNLFISQFSSVTSPVIIDVPPIRLHIINPTDTQSIQNTFQIDFQFTHFRIPFGGYSLPLFISLDTFKPQVQLIITSSVVDLPENGVSIYKGRKITLTPDQSSSYIQLKSDSSVSTMGAHGILQVVLSGENASSFILKDQILTFEIVQSDQVSQKSSSQISSQDIEIFINPSTLSPISQIIQVLSSQSLTLYYTVSSNFTQFNIISLNDIISNMQSGILQDYNYMNQIQTQYGSWVYEGNSGLQDFYIENHYESTMYLVKIFPLNSQGYFLGQFIGNYTTSSNSGTLLKTIFRFQSGVSIAQQIDLACKLSQYFAVNQLFLTSTTGVRCDSPSTMIDTKLQTHTVKIQALDNPNPQFVSFYFSYNKADLYNNYNSQIYSLLVNQKQTIISWYASQISSNRYFQKLLDFQAINRIQTNQPQLNSSLMQYIASQSWVYVSNIQLNSNGYIWIMVDLVGNYPPNYLQIRMNQNSQSKQALSNYVSYYNQITNKSVAFNVTGLNPKTQYDFFFAITSDDSSQNMSYPPTVFSLTLETK